MPAPRHVRITFSGVLGTTGSGAEIWSCSLSAFPGSLPESTDSALLTSLSTVAGTAFTAWTTHVKPSISPAVRLTKVKLSLVEDNGKVGRTAAGAYKQGEFTGDTAGTGAQLNLPWQTALAVRVESNFAGPTGRGRYFLPLPGVESLPGDGLITATNASGLAAAQKGFLDAINDQVSTAWTGVLCVASGGSPTKGLQPALHPIRRVKVGRVLDTMRSRRNDLLEQYSSATLVTI